MIKKLKKYKIYIFEILSVIILMSFGISSNIGMIGFIVLIGVSLLFLSRSESFMIVLFLYPFANLLKLNSSGLSFIYVLMSMVVLVSLVKGRIIYLNKPQKTAILLFIALLLYEVVACVVRTRSFDVSSLILRIVVPFSFLLFVSIDKDIKVDMAVHSLTISSIIAGILFLSADFIPILKMRLISKGTYEYGTFLIHRLSGLSGNPNIYSFILNICIASLIALYNNKKKNIIYYIELICLSVLGIMTLSKSFFIAYILTIAIFVLISQKKITPFTASMFILIFIVIIVFMNNSTYFSAFMSRLTDNEDNINGLTSARIEIWQFYIKYIISKPEVFFFGVSMGGTLLRKFGVEVGPHNAFIESLYYYGAFGTAFFFGFLIMLFNNAIKDRKGFNIQYSKAILLYLPIVVYVFRLFAITLWFRIDFAFLTAVILLVLRCNNIGGFNNESAKAINQKYFD